MEFKNTLFCLIGILMILLFTGQVKQLIILLVIVILGSYLYKNFDSPRELLNKVEEQFTNKYKIKDNTSRLSKIGKKIPEIYSLNKSKKKIDKYLKDYLIENKKEDLGLILSMRIEYYFNNIYFNIEDILYNDVYPQHIFITMMDNKHHLYRTLTSLIYVLPSSNLPDDYNELVSELDDKFKKIIIKLTNFINKKDNKKIHTASGFIPNLDDPVAKNMFFDNLGPY